MKRCCALLLLCLLLLSGCGGQKAEAPFEGTTLTLATWLSGGEPIDSLVRRFNESHTDIRIELMDFTPEDLSQAAASLDQAHASFVAGNTPDLYYTVSFDAAKLRNAGLVADWYPLMEADPDFDPANYQTHIWELLETDGALYQLCTAFDLFGTGGPAALVGDRTGWTLAEFEDWLSGHAEEVTVTGERMLQLMLWYGCQFDFIDTETLSCDFENQDFLDWLDFLGRLPQTGTSSLRVARFDGPWMHGIDATGMDTVEDWSHPERWQFLRYVGLPTAGRDGPAVAITDSFALSSTTEKTEACWTFIRWMLSEETQTTLYTTTYAPTTEFEEDEPRTLAIPIRKDVWEEQLRCAGLDSSHEDSLFVGMESYEWPDEDDGEPVETPRPGLPQAELDYLRDLVANANRTAMGFFDYESLTKIIEEEVLAFLAGDRSAADCARLIQSRVGIMLAEMQ